MLVPCSQTSTFIPWKRWTCGWLGQFPARYSSGQRSLWVPVEQGSPHSQYGHNPKKGENTVDTEGSIPENLFCIIPPWILPPQKLTWSSCRSSSEGNKGLTLRYTFTFSVLSSDGTCGRIPGQNYRLISAIILKQMASIAQFLKIILTLPSFHLKCLSVAIATLWFHNHSNLHRFLSYFVPFLLSLQYPVILGYHT